MGGVDRANRKRERWEMAVRWGLDAPLPPWGKTHADGSPMRFPAWCPEVEPWANPTWDDVGKVHDWRNYVPDGMRKDWQEMDYETRIAVYVMAEARADTEAWD